MKCAPLLTVLLLAIGCSQDTEVATNVESSNPVVNERANTPYSPPSRPSLADCIYASARMEQALAGLVEELGFVYREDLTEHPHEASSYARVYSAPWSETVSIDDIKTRLTASSSTFIQVNNKDGFVLENKFPFPVKIEEHQDVIHTVTFIEDGRELYSNESHDRFLVIEFCRVILVPEE